MKRLSSALLAIGLIAASTTAFAQSGYDGRYQNDRYDTQGVGSQSEAHYDYARVIRVDPAFDSGYGGYDDHRTASYGNQRCYETTTAGRYERDGYSSGSYRNDGYYGGRDGYGNQGGRNVATIVGGIAGAVLGSKMGGGSGTYATTAIGSMVGGMAGRQIYDQTQQDRYVRPATVRVCDPEPVRSNGYGSYNNGYNNGYDNVRTGNATAYDVTYEYAGRRYTRRMDYHPGERVRVRVDVSPQ